MPNLLQASDYQGDDDPALVLADSRETRIQNAIEDAFEALIVAYGSDLVLTMISRYDMRGLLALLNDPAVIAAVTGAYAPIAQTREDAAEGEAEQYGTVLSFDRLANASALMVQRKQFVDALLTQARATLQQTLISSLRYGADPEAIQAALQNVISLTPQQATAVSNFRRALENGDSSALNRVLRDRRFDGTVQRSIDSGNALSEEQIDAMVERYAERQIAYRAETIARTEAMNAATGGIRDAYVQAVDSGNLRNSEVKRFWLVTLDERTCPICTSIPILNPNGVGLMQPYMSVEGPVMMPGIHPRCRCSERYQANTSRLSVQPFALAA